MTQPYDKLTGYSRVVLMLMKCCAEVERKVLETYITRLGQTLDQFLNQNRNVILNKEIGKKRQALLFPTSQTANIQDWDLAIICFIITDFTNVPQQYKEVIIKHLRPIRNQLCHSCNTELNESEYRDAMDRLKTTISLALSYSNDSAFGAQINTEMAVIEQSTMAVIEQSTTTPSMWFHQMNSWFTIDGEVMERLDNLSQDHRYTHSKLDQLFKMFGPVAIPDTGVDIVVNNCTADKEAVISKRLVDNFRNCIQNLNLTANLDNAQLVAIQNAVGDAFKMLVNEGQTVVSAMESCVKLIIRCSSLEVLFTLIERCASGYLTELFYPIESEVKKLEGFREYSQQVVMYKHIYVNCIYKLVENLCDALASTGITKLSPSTQKATVTRLGVQALRLTFHTDGGETPLESEEESVEFLFQSLSDLLTRAFPEDKLTFEVDFKEGEKGFSSSGRRHDRESYQDTDIAIQQDCHICERTSTKTPANHFCVNCKEYLCNACAGGHTTTTQFQNHTLLQEKDMPKSFPRNGNQSDSGCTEICTKHTGEVLQFYCQSHDSICCVLCAAGEHNNCLLSNIPEFAANYKDGQSYTSLKSVIGKLENNAKQCIDGTNANLKAVADINDAAVTEFKKLRTELNAYLDKQENELLTECTRFKQEDETQLGSFKSKCEKITADVQQLRSNLATVELESSKLFILSQKVLGDIKSFEATLDKCDAESKIHRYSFKREKAMEDIMVSQMPMGKLYRSMADAKIARMPDVMSKALADTEDCKITGSAVLLSGDLLVVDNDNNAVKMIDTTTNTITSRLHLSSAPWDVTTLGTDGQAAVTVPERKKIKVLSTHPNLSVTREIKVKGKCRGIDCRNNVLAVSFDSPEPGIEIMNLEGTVLHSISNRKNVTGRSLFKAPNYISISDDANFIYVSDYDTNTVKKMSTAGKVIFTYTDAALSGPYGMSFSDDGFLLICDWGNSNVHLISKDGKKIRTMLTDVHFPFSVCHHPGTNQIFVSSSGFMPDSELQNNIKVYKIL